MKQDNVERRFFAVDGIEIREGGATPIELSGHAAVFNSLSLDLGGFRERIKRGTFKDTISEDDPLAIVSEGSDAQPGHWPIVKNPTVDSDMHAESGNGYPMRTHFLEQGLARFSDDLPPGFEDLMLTGETETGK